MTDIVERLRGADISGHGSYSALMRDAADEIERLTAECEAWRVQTADEIERLRREVHDPLEEPDGVANLRAILADKPYLNSVLTVYQILMILDNKGGFMPDEAVVWFREMTLRGDWRD